MLALTPARVHIVIMKRTVRREHIDHWIKGAGEKGLEQLAIKSRVSTRVIANARAGIPPKKAVTRQLLCRTIGVSENSLFPLVDAGEEEAG